MEPTTEKNEHPEPSIAFQAGQKAREMRIPLRQSALRALRPGCKQYDDFIDGYEYESQKRKRVSKSKD